MTQISPTSAIAPFLPARPAGHGDAAEADFLALMADPALADTTAEPPSNPVGVPLQPDAASLPKAEKPVDLETQAAQLMPDVPAQADFPLGLDIQPTLAALPLEFPSLITALEALINQQAHGLPTDSSEPLPAVRLAEKTVPFGDVTSPLPDMALREGGKAATSAEVKVPKAPIALDPEQMGRVQVSATQPGALAQADLTEKAAAEGRPNAAVPSRLAAQSAVALSDKPAGSSPPGLSPGQPKMEADAGTVSAPIKGAEGPLPIAAMQPLTSVAPNPQLPLTKAAKDEGEAVLPNDPAPKAPLAPVAEKPAHAVGVTVEGTPPKSAPQIAATALSVLPVASKPDGPAKALVTQQPLPVTALSVVAIDRAGLPEKPVPKQTAPLEKPVENRNAKPVRLSAALVFHHSLGEASADPAPDTAAPVRLDQAKGPLATIENALPQSEKPMASGGQVAQEEAMDSRETNAPDARKAQSFAAAGKPVLPLPTPSPVAPVEAVAPPGTAFSPNVSKQAHLAEPKEMRLALASEAVQVLATKPAMTVGMPVPAQAEPERSGPRKDDIPQSAEPTDGFAAPAPEAAPKSMPTPVASTLSEVPSEIIFEDADPMALGMGFLGTDRAQSTATAQIGSTQSAGATPTPAAQIAEAVASSAEGTVELRLSPEELGQVRIDMRKDGDGMVVQISAERQDTLDLLRRNADQLAAELRAAGNQTINMSFGRWSGSGQNEGQPGPTPEGFSGLAASDTPKSSQPFHPPKGLYPGLYLRI